MIENFKIINNKQLADFCITALSDADFRTKMEDVPSLLEADDKAIITVEGFVKDLKTKPFNSDLQNSAMLFLELVLRGNLKISQIQLQQLSDFAYTA